MVRGGPEVTKLGLDYHQTCLHDRVHHRHPPSLARFVEDSILEAISHTLIEAIRHPLLHFMHRVVLENVILPMLLVGLGSPASSAILAFPARVVLESPAHRIANNHHHRHPPSLACLLICPPF